jgi:glycine/D-amino acid oxidase-like deaminating enzyme
MPATRISKSFTIDNFANEWGQSPWRWRFGRKRVRVPARADVVVVGGGFSGLSAATWLARLAPEKRVVLLEADEIGAGASGRTGGMALAESAGGDLPGLGDVLGGFAEILDELRISCKLSVGGAWELGRAKTRTDSEISWSDSGRLRVVREVRGGTVDAGELLRGLTRAALREGVRLIEHQPVRQLRYGKEVRVQLGKRQILAKQVLIATNAQSLELAGLQKKAMPKLTMAIATEPLSARTIKAIGMESRRPFYTVDLPYLWGRLTKENRVIFGAGLASVREWEELHRLKVGDGAAAALLHSLETRIRGLHPALRKVKFTHAWGGPILLTDGARPIFSHVHGKRNVLYFGGYNGHGVALSVYLGRWAAEALLGRRELPRWAE